MSLNLKAVQLEVSFQEADKDAAWELYIEMLTRVVTQPLSAESGDEQTALDSVSSLFPTTREILRCRGRTTISFSKVAIPVLNQVVRPFTAKWHRESIAGAFQQEGKREEFRREMASLQGGPAQLQPYAGGDRRCGGPHRLGRAYQRVAMGTRHNIFLSYYHEQDQKYKDTFVRMMGDNIVDRSVDLGDIIDNNLPSEAVLQRIREDYIAQVSVTVVLLGRCTWQRKYVDWEIGASLRDTQTNPRCGLLGILLPNHPDCGNGSYNPRLMPSRLADNCWDSDTFARIYDWTKEPLTVRSWIHKAFLRRKRQPDPNISMHPFGQNRSGDCSRGWQ